ncbi:alpha/beta hydrolase [Bosea caraganae]|uniref:Alpha/beta hydrolase n=1 Tax=Bosea caraganae TaxID=2763117 RepID=A0A370L6P9_9HYPH|nr:alpha/beta hydrolase [Bosea caraganae]RDJ25303.1 alpha/beta hydrolase [Bosea caraganae]RDJ25914.1 alpha/beta hydrolase [Bosea caraganae]
MLRTTVRFLLLALALLLPATAFAEEVVDLGGLFGGGRALLNKPAGKAKAGLILLTGGDGNIGIGADGSIQAGGNWIVRTRGAYARSGIASLTLDYGADPTKAIELMRTIAPRVIVVAMSRGALKVGGTLASRPDGIVFASALLEQARPALGDPASLPPMLIIQHRQDGCRLSTPDGAIAFQQWAGSRARTVWIDGGTTQGDPCQARAHHGFVGRESAVVSAITGFAGSLR